MQTAGPSSSSGSSAMYPNQPLPVSEMQPPRLASKGRSARQIADAMGHKRTTTTELYIQTYNKPQADDLIRQAMSG